MNASRRSIAAAAAVLLLVSATLLVVRLTLVKPAAIPCPRCGSTDVKAVPAVAETTYFCRKCGHSYSGPASPGVDWMDAFDFWLSD